MKNSLVTQLQAQENKTKNNDSLTRLVKKIKQVESEQRILNNCVEDLERLKKIVNPKIKKAHKKLISSKKQLLAHYIKKYKLKSLRVTDYEMIEGFIEKEMNELQERFGIWDFDEELMDMLDELEKISFQRMSAQEKEYAEESFNNLKKETFLSEDMTFEDFQNHLFSKEDFINYQRKMQEEFLHEQKRELQKKQKNTFPDFKNLYKKLVAKIHPDKTTDLEEKERREEMIKQLNTNWEARDYHALLNHWIEIDPENELNFQWDEKKIQFLYEELNQKLQNITYQKFEFKRSPAYCFYKENFRGKKVETIEKSVVKFIEDLETIVSTDQSIIASTKTLKLLKSYLDEKLKIEEDLFFNMMLDDWEDDFDD